jgi:hypothetical protein
MVRRPRCAQKVRVPEKIIAGPGCLTGDTGVDRPLQMVPQQWPVRGMNSWEATPKAVVRNWSTLAVRSVWRE